MRKCAVLVLICGCGAGEEDSSKSFPSDSSLDGVVTVTTPGSGLVWVDAEGEVVDGVVELLGQIAYVDDDGHFWALDPWGAGEDAFGALAEFEVAYADSGCTNEVAHRNLPPPGFVMEGQSFTDYKGRWLVADPEDRKEAPLYGTSGDGCEGSDPEPFVLISDLEEVAPPYAWWTPPLAPVTR